MSDLGGFSLFELFKAEAETHGATLNEGLVRLESTPSDLSGIEPLMRAAHSLKGAARIIGVDLAVGLAHAMEDCLVAIQQGRETLVPARIDQLLQGTDVLARLGQISESELAAFTEREQAGVDALVASLREPAALGDASPPPLPAAASAATPEPAVREPDTAPAPSPTSTRVSPAERAPSPDSTATPLPAAAVTEVRTLRVNAANLDRMMRLAGEMMIESRRFSGLRESVRRLKGELESLAGELEQAGETRETAADAAAAASHRARGRRTRSAAAARESLTTLQRTLLGHASDLEGMFRRSEEAATALYHEVLGSRMRPFADGTAGFSRMVRDLARSLGKNVRFELLGGTVPVDRDILGKLEAPLNHMLRNCIDHGVETPTERRAAGKDETARVFIEARHHGGMLQVRVGDDGRGIDPERVRRKIVERGLQAPEIVATLEGGELYDFLFLPGFSTASAVTEVSGRGVGLDVVQTMVQETGGSLRVESEFGRGSVFAMRLPITLSVIRAALVEIAGETYAFPLSRLERVVRVPRGQIRPVEGRQQFDLEGSSVGLVESTTVLGLPRPAESGEDASVMVVGQPGAWFGLVVDRFLGEEDLVVRPLDPRLGRVPHIASAALLEDGSPLLIVDTDDLVASIRQLLGEGRLRGMRPADAPAARRRRRVLVVEDSITVREVERQLLVRMGYEVEVAVDGVDGWNALQAGGYDLVVTDVDMPRMNGIELVRTLRADPRFRTIPVVIVSYKDREEDRLRGLEAGANAYLTKGSFHDRSFATTVTDLIGAADA